MPPVKLRSRSQGRPAPMCSFKECGRYCVRIMMSLMPELTQLERVKSMMRYLPAKGTARLSVRTPSREPSPPARITARIFTLGLRPSSSGAPGPLVELGVEPRGAAPGKVRLHSPQLKACPLLWVRVHRKRALQGVPQSAGVEIVEQDSRSRGLPDIANRIR